MERRWRKLRKKMKEIENLSVRELRDKLKELRMELLKLNAERFGKKTLSNPGRYREVKKTIARILTLLRRRGSC